jgi:hypothetical protein
VGETFTADTVAFDALSFPVQTVGGPTGDGTYNISSNGYIAISTLFSIGGPYVFDISAYGGFDGGGWPIMELLIDGYSVGQVEVSSPQLADDVFTASVTSGTHSIAIALINDSYGGSGLYVQSLTIASWSSLWGSTTRSASPPPTPAPSPDAPAAVPAPTPIRS